MIIKSALNTTLMQTSGPKAITIYVSPKKSVTVATGVKTLLMYTGSLLKVDRRWFWGEEVIVDFTGEEEKVILDAPLDISDLVNDKQWIEQNKLSPAQLKKSRKALRDLLSLESTDQLSIADIVLQKELRQQLLINLAIEKASKQGGRNWR